MEIKMLKSMTMGLGALALLAACDVSYPVAVVGPGNTVYRGQATALFLEGGFFQATNGSNVCRGQYQPVAAGQTSTFPVNCTNGVSGIGTARFEDGRSGGGFITMQDGSQWQFIFGRGALRV
jgi:hypothetical protein